MEGVPPQLAGTERGVAVEAGAAFALRVVEVHAGQHAGAKKTRGIVQKFYRVFRAPHVDARGVGVAGVEADADARGVLDAVQNGREVGKGAAQATALARGVFKHDADALGFVEREVDGPGRAAKGGGRVHELEVAPGVEGQRAKAERVAKPEFRHKGVEGAHLFVVVGVGDVDEVAGVGQDAGGGVTVFAEGVLKGGNFTRGRRRGAPLPLVFDKKGEPGGAGFAGVGGGVGNAAPDADVRADEAHGKIRAAWE